MDSEKETVTGRQNGSIQGPKGLTMREATAGDYEAILAINRNVYAELDYIPALFFPFLHNPNIRMYVGQADGKIVLFRAAWIREYDQDVAHMAVRVNTEYQGRGFNTYGQDWVHQTLKLSLERPLYGLMVQRFNEQLHGPNGKNRITSGIRREWNSTVYIMSKEEISLALEKSKASFQNNLKHVERFGIETTMSQLKRPSSFQLIRRDGDYMACYNNAYPIKVTERNLVLLAKTNANFQFTMDDGESRAISSSNHFKSNNKTMRADLHYYGVADVNTWASHVLYYLRYLLVISSNVDTYKIMLHFPENLDVSITERVLLPLLGTRVTTPPYNVTKGVLSRAFKPIVSAAKH